MFRRRRPCPNDKAAPPWKRVCVSWWRITKYTESELWRHIILLCPHQAQTDDSKVFCVVDEWTRKEKSVVCEEEKNCWPRMASPVCDDDECWVACLSREQNKREQKSNEHPMSSFSYLCDLEKKKTPNRLPLPFVSFGSLWWENNFHAML